MKVYEALTLLGEFPEKIITDYFKKGNLDIVAFFSSYSSQEIIEIMYNLGYRTESDTEAIQDIAKKLTDYIIELNKIYNHIKVPEESQEAENGTQNAKLEDMPDYKKLLIIVRRMAEIGNFDLSRLTLFNAHGILALDFKPVKSIEELLKEVEEKINSGNEEQRIRRQSVWDASIKRGDNENRKFIMHFLESDF